MSDQSVEDFTKEIAIKMVEKCTELGIQSMAYGSPVIIDAGEVVAGDLKLTTTAEFGNVIMGACHALDDEDNRLNEVGLELASEFRIDENKSNPETH